MISDVKQQEIKELVDQLYLIFLYKKCLHGLKYNVPKNTYFSFNFAWDFIQLGFFSIKNRGVGGGGLLNGQNLLSVIKVIG